MCGFLPVNIKLTLCEEKTQKPKINPIISSPDVKTSVNIVNIQF